jgi:uncharacterized RDD family membrane protein YckC
MPCPNHPARDDLRPCPACGGDFCRDCIPADRDRCPACRDNPYARPASVTPDAADGRARGQAELDVADIGGRFLAWLIDQGLAIGVAIVLLVLIMGGYFAVVHFQGDDPHASDPATAAGVLVGLVLVLIGAVMALIVVYEAVMLTLYGQTVGKMVARVVVVCADGTPITARRAWLRAIARCAFSIIPYRLGVIVDALFIFSEDGATLHDRIAVTRVVIKPGERA